MEVLVNEPKVCTSCGGKRVFFWKTTKYFFCPDCKRLVGDRVEDPVEVEQTPTPHD